LRVFSFGGYGLALAALALVLFGAYDSYPSLANNAQQMDIFIGNFLSLLSSVKNPAGSPGEYRQMTRGNQ